MRSNKLFWIVSLVLAVAGFTGGSLMSHETSTEAGKAVWKEVYRSPAEMAAGVDAIVIARVIATRPGRVPVTRASTMASTRAAISAGDV